MTDSAKGARFATASGRKSLPDPRAAERGADGQEDFVEYLFLARPLRRQSPSRGWRRNEAHSGRTPRFAAAPVLCAGKNRRP
jgi:hypothetical protein